MDKDKAIYYSAIQALTDHHIQLEDLFDGEDAEFAQELNAEYVSEQNQYDSEEVVEAYKMIAKDQLRLLKIKKELIEDWPENKWESSYQDMKEIVEKDSAND